MQYHVVDVAPPQLRSATSPGREAIVTSISLLRSGPSLSSLQRLSSLMLAACSLAFPHASEMEGVRRGKDAFRHRASTSVATP